MKINVLGIEENVNSINDIKKYVKNSTITLINIPHQNGNADEIIVVCGDAHFFHLCQMMDFTGPAIWYERVTEGQNPINIGQSYVVDNV